MKLLIILIMLSSCGKQLSPTKKIARKISRTYNDMGMKDSAAHWKKISKTIQ